ncbi:tRNA (adenosine(37)-N6)-threonylcarbamoyltransferase complex transferase subunit TsaD [Patescibacteria group bacterium]|nr:tRNA (adenosine(37)-N6)-threonylcarbamoyltransferase complex transferase subunit TsaD [Patescibacteria group bacterium]
MLILGVETSCDETAAAVVKDGGLVLSNIVSSQTELHAPYGGVVPEVAARDHVKNIIPIVDQALQKAKVNLKKIDAIAVTKGPGLVTSLLVGVDTAKSLAYTTKKNIVGINHLEAHVYASQLQEDGQEKPVGLKFPLIYLIASGGHTELVLMEDHLKHTTIGATRDDAAGEAFDKIAKLLKLDYPGGPEIAERANSGNSRSYAFPRPMLEQGYEFSFSGLKTDVLRLVKKNKYKLPPQAINNICASFQAAVAEVLTTKTIKAAQEHQARMIVIGGGVSANRLLRWTLQKKAQNELEEVKLLIPDVKYCTDNAAMVAALGFYYAREGKFNAWDKLKVEPNLNFSQSKKC